MGHSHNHIGHHHHHGHHHSGTKNIKVAFFLNLGFTLVEILGGLLTNSVAILADAVHDLGDSVSLGLAWFLQTYSQKASNERYTYGYGRFSLLGAFINAVVLIGGSLFVLAESIPRLIAPESPDAKGVVLFALVGIAINGTAAFRLRGGQTMNEKVITWHLLEDVLGWVAVLLIGIILLFVDIPIVDPILAILFTLYVLFNVIKNLRATVSLFLQRVPDNVDVDEISRRFSTISGVCSAHHTHLWSVDGQENVLTTHLVVNSQSNRADVLRIKQASQTIVTDLNVRHLTIEIEYEGEDCLVRSPSV